ncbi:MAG: filamentous hemagglutinin family protein [Pseudomonadota bacterium]
MHTRARSLLPSTAAAGLVLLSGLSAQSLAQELPVPCSGGACGANGPATWVTDGSVTGSIAGNTFNINQATQSATLNWASFNIGANGVVNFNQPDSASVAINNIFQSDPSQIFGALNANGQVYLINQNGILFGESAQVNVGGLIASSLGLTPQAIADGIVGASLESAPAFAAFVDQNGDPLPSGAITVENGAFLGAEGGQIFLFAPEVVNRGTIETPDGQTVLAAGQEIYLAASDDPNLRGLIVEVNGDGVATNGDPSNAAATAGELIGQIAADRGNVTIAGFAVNQLGRVSATTSVRQNGSIRLVARRDVGVRVLPDNTVDLLPTEGGTLVVGERAENVIALETASDESTVDVNEQPPSTIELDGATIDILADAQLVAPAGQVTITARANPQVQPEFAAAEPNDTRLFIDSGVSIDVSGADVERSVEDNIIQVELRGNQLADSPAQREGDIRSDSVLVDIRQRGVRADGSEWQGTPLADASGEISNIERTVGERSLVGGTIDLSSEGAVIVADGAVLDVSGGVATYNEGDVTTSRVLGADGQIYDIAEADRDREYVSVIDSFVVEHPRWGVTEVFDGFQADASGTFEQGYVEGYDAGSVSIISPRFILDGAIVAETVAGRYQRFAPGSFDSSVSLYRPFDQLPLGGQLTLGGDLAPGGGAFQNSVLGNVDIASGLVLPTLTNANGDPFNPRNDRLDDEFVSRLRPELVGTDRVARTTVLANGQIAAGEELAFDLPGAASIDLTAAEIIFGADVASIGGSVSLTARPSVSNAENPSLTVTGGANIDLSGVWVNDNPLISDATDPRLIDGGTFSAVANEGDLTLAEGSVIDVSGGAYRDADGTVTAGTAGSITLASSPDRSAETSATVIDAEFRAFALLDGGSLSITAGLICIAANDCADDDGELSLTPDLFVPAGFSSVSVNSNQLGIDVAPNTQIAAQQVNREFNGNTSLIASGTPLETFTDIVTLPDVFRRPVNVSLNAATSDSILLDLDAFNSAQGLILGEGSRIDLDPRATLDLASNSTISLQGSIRAQAGTVNVSLSNNLVPLLTRPSGGIWLGDNASIDVSGTSLSQVDSLNRRLGEVFDGGVVNITANRDGIVLTPGSVIDVSGTETVLTVRTGTANAPGFADQLVGSNGGALNLAAAEYVLTSGTLNGAGGDVDGTAGAALSIDIDAQLRGNDPTGGREPSLSLNTRRIIVSEQTDRITVALGASVPEAFVGVATISAEQIEQGGFYDLALSAETLQTFRNGQPFIASIGEVILAGGLSLELPGRLTIDAPRLIGGTGDALVSASSIRLGHESVQLQQIGDALDNPFGSLHLNADLIDLLANVRVAGFEDVNLVSAGDIRATGLQVSGINTLPGSLVTDAPLTLTATQVYPTTLSDFRFVVEGETGLLTVAPATGPGAPVLSAGGTLTLDAATVNQQGVVRAPYGTINLTGTDVLLADGSVTSTSLDGQIVPFGTLQGGLDWTFSLGFNETLVFDGELQPVPEQRVNLDAANVDLQDGARIDVSAGGDLLAYEFVPGIGGSTDYLSVDDNPNLFAIIPDLNLSAAPIDPAESDGVNLAVGDSVFLDGIGDLPAGNYTLLPARYAILPGALLISPVEGYTDILPGEAFQGLDGSVIIAGRATVNGTDVRATRSQGFALLPRSRAFEEAQYDLALASEFFADTTARTPLDAGTVSLNATATLNLAGELVATTNNRGAALDIASEFLRIVDNPTGAENFVEIRADDVAALGAESVLIGGQRTIGKDGVTIAPTASVVEVADGVTVPNPELLLVATDRVTVGEGAQLVATGNATATSDLLVDGDAALIRTSAGAQRNIVRTNATGLSGDVDVQAGAVLSATGSIALDATRDAVSDGTIDIDGGSLRLGAASIVLGDAPADSSGLVLDNAALSSINASDVLLVSRADVSVFGMVSLDVSERLSINASGLTAASGAEFDLIAPTVVLSGNGVAAPPLTGDGRINVQASNLEFGDGLFTLNGVDQALFNASDTTSFAGVGELVSAGDVVFSAGLFTLGAGADYRVQASNALRLTAQGDGGTGASVPGGRLVLASDSDIEIDARVDAASGILEAVAGGNVIVGANSQLDASGDAFDFDGLTVAAPGGSVALRSATGDVQLAAGAIIDASSAASGRGGTIDLEAAGGTVTNGAALFGGGAEGGRLRVDANNIANSSALIDAAAAGGFSGELSLRQRGPGDLDLSTGQVVTASSLRLQADQGNVSVAGTIELAGDRQRSLDLVASDDVRVTGTIRVAEAGADDFGSVIRLSSANAGVFTGAASVIETAGDTELWISVTRDVLGSLLDADASNDMIGLAGEILGDAAIIVEGRQTYDVADGSIDAADTAADMTNPWFADAVNFMSNADALTAALGFADDARFDLLPGVVLQSTGDLTVASDFNLFNWRFNDVDPATNDERPGVLTLRAGGDLLLNASVNDAFSSVFLPFLTYDGDSWSYRLTAGADLAAADLLSTNPGTGDITIAPLALVRTGNGRIDVATGRDFVLSDQTSVLYTSGIATEGVLLASAFGFRLYPDEGGDITLRAGRDILGAESDQLFTSWLWRTGRSLDGVLQSSVGWTINFGSFFQPGFQQGIGALGGGNVAVAAGRDILDLSASVPTVGRQIGGVAPADNLVEVIAGGNLTVEAGRDVLGGAYLVGQGVGEIVAGGRFDEYTQFAPIIALGDAQVDVTARGDASLELGVSPTFVPQAFAQVGNSPTQRSYFSTYTDTTSLSIASIAGTTTTTDLILASDSYDRAYREGRFTSLREFDPDQVGLILLPPSVDLVSFSEDVLLPTSLTLYPSATGNLNLLAANNVTVGSQDDAIALILSDVGPRDRFSLDFPTQTFDGLDARFSNVIARGPEFNATTPVHLGDPDPVRVVALNGDVTMIPGLSGSPLFYSAKPVRVSAGRDIINFSLEAQHTDAADATVFSAGRDINYPSIRADQGQLLANNAQLTINGPGLLQLRAGRDIDLQTSDGITSAGDINNSVLPDGGAAVSLIAGLGDSEPDFATFIETYFVDGSDYNDALIDFVNTYLDQPVNDKTAALAAFDGLSTELQESFVEQAFFAELRTSGREAASPGELNNDFTRGFDALTTLFPGSNPNVEEGEVNAYVGDVRLFFSRVYTLDGGSIRLLVPGGQINAGLATPPESFGINKPPEELGIVAQRFGDIQGLSFDDFAVNESRVFAADGGDILIWSTRGDIDAGRGAKTAISAPPPVITIDPTTGATQFEFPAALTGSGIQTLATSPGVEPGNVDLFAPRGVVNAGDAGIVAGNLTIAAVAVLGADNIQVSGVAVGVPTDTAIAPGLANVSAVAASATNTAQATVAPAGEDEESDTPLADQALGFLDVFILGFGDCNPETGEGCDSP